jgi:hypothetical protein
MSQSGLGLQAPVSGGFAPAGRGVQHSTATVAFWAAGAALLALALGGSWAAQRQLDRFLGELDGDALLAAKRVLDRSLEQQRSQVLSQVGVLAEDNRIRATVIMPNPDEGTIRDVLDDLMKTSGAGLLAVLDVQGKVRAVTGIEGLREVGLGSSAVVKAAVEHPAAYIWTFPKQVLAIGVAPVRFRGEIYAYLVMGFEAAKPALVAIKEALGVSAAALIGDKIVASSSDDPSLGETFREAAAGDEETNVLLRNGGQDYLSRVTRVSNSVASAKVVWLVLRHRQAEPVRLLRLATWTPSLAAFFLLALLLVVSRRGDGKAS